ncbi:ankycorbin isoform X3 [Hydra vulgaris]|uniref:Ankycorbin isoform X3 n=1 Tax=Hydra vulgaris TaxID=6087 RepID=A0ABM4BIP3_HYDVU
MADEDPLKVHRDLLIACGWGKEIDVILLLQQGGSVRVQDQDGKNCLHYSACKGHIQVTNLLIEKGCAINARDKGYRTPLHLASEEGHHDIVSILLDNNAEYNIQDEEGNTPCHVACINNSYEVVELFIHVKADLNIKNKDGYTPLHIATVNSHLQSMTLLLNAGVNRDAQEINGNTPLHLASQMKSLKALKCLISYGADVNLQNHDGDTALHLCADNGSVALVQYILNCGHPVELSPNNVGDTAKDIAIRRGYKDIVSLIPDPFKKIKSHRSAKSSGGSATSPSNSFPSPHTSLPDLQEAFSYGAYKNGQAKSFLQHPSEEIPSATSSSMLSLWVPTTDSGISLPLDKNSDRYMSSLQRRKKSHRDEHKLSKYDKYDLHTCEGRKHKKLTKKNAMKSEMKTYEYTELRKDPRFISPQLSTKNCYNVKPGCQKKKIFETRLSNAMDDSGVLSDESLQYYGCFPRNKTKRTNRSFFHNKQELSLEKELVIQRQAELQYQLNESKLALEKQMRKMRKKFEKALRVTDERFLEQKKREENYHNQLKYELEIIEKSLERGSKKNVEEFTQHIKNELNNLSEKLTKNAEMNDDREKKKRHRASFVDLDRKISVSLSKNINSTVKLRNPSDDREEHSNAARSDFQNNINNSDLVKEVKSIRNDKTDKDKENELLRARVLELEKMVKEAKGEL